MPLPMMTIPEVATHLRCHPLTVRSLLNRGLRYVRVGRSIRIEPEALAEFIQRNRR
jgi:excisionase family DNA binding protein